MNKEIDANPQECDLVEKAIIEVLIRNGKLAKSTERVLWAVLALIRLIQHYELGKIPKSIPITEYAKHNQRHQQELIGTDRLSSRTLYEIVDDLTGVKRMAFTLMGIDKKTGKKTTVELCPFDYVIRMGDSITIEYLALSQSYKQYLNEHNYVAVELTPPKRSLF